MKDRKPNRLKDYEYSQNGSYFITICIKNRIPWFGTIIDGKMILNDNGKVIDEQWLWLGKQYDYVMTDKYVIMPNHFHAILNIKDETWNGHERSRPFPTENKISIFPCRCF